MNDRKEFMQELELREYIQKAIKVVKERRRDTLKSHLREELEVRKVIQKLIKEAEVAVSDSAVHSNTGINALEDLFKNTNLLTVLRQGYKSLTSKKEQRESYKNHILNAVEISLRTEESRYEGPAADEAPQNLDEQDIHIDVPTEKPEDNPAFIDVEKKEPTAEDEVETFSLAGHDKTGRNRAFTDYKNVLLLMI